jgi:hypothetical protein
MKKNKKLFEPIRRGAPSLLFDFTEALKEMEVEYPYPRKVDENRYEIAPNMYCNKNGLKDYFDEFKRTLGMKKKYCFDYIKEDVMKWASEVRKTMTKQMIYMLPLRVNLPFIFSDRYIPAMDYYGEVIDNYDEWKRQREEYIDNLYDELKEK